MAKKIVSPKSVSLPKNNAVGVVNLLYLQLLQTIASLVVSLINADQDNDGRIETTEIFAILSPLLLNGLLIKNQATAFVEHFKNYQADQVREDLRNLIQLQLLPNQYGQLENKIDQVLDGILDIYSGGTKISEVFRKK